MLLFQFTMYARKVYFYTNCSFEYGWQILALNQLRFVWKFQQMPFSSWVSFDYASLWQRNLHQCSINSFEVFFLKKLPISMLPKESTFANSSQKNSRVLCAGSLLDNYLHPRFFQPRQREKFEIFKTQLVTFTFNSNNSEHCPRGLFTVWLRSKVIFLLPGVDQNVQTKFGKSKDCLKNWFFFEENLPFT